MGKTWWWRNYQIYRPVLYIYFPRLKINNIWMRIKLKKQNCNKRNWWVIHQSSSREQGSISSIVGFLMNILPEYVRNEALWNILDFRWHYLWNSWVSFPTRSGSYPPWSTLPYCLGLSLSLSSSSSNFASPSIFPSLNLLSHLSSSSSLSLSSSLPNFPTPNQPFSLQLDILLLFVPLFPSPVSVRLSQILS